jgi:hypothetical protein
VLRGCSLIRSTNNEANYFPGNEVRYYNGTPAIGERVPGKVAENIDVGCPVDQLESFLPCLCLSGQTIMTLLVLTANHDPAGSRLFSLLL